MKPIDLVLWALYPIATTFLLLFLGDQQESHAEEFLSSLERVAVRACNERGTFTINNTTFKCEVLKGGHR